MEDYRTIRGTATGEYEEKKSRFIASMSFADSEEAAVAFLEQVRAANRTARHNVYAYRLREGNRERYSDDGEPAKTAGTPALEVLQHSGLTDLIVVVTRYFGGVLLGTGGLVRAYTTATARALENAEVVTVRSVVELSVTVDYSLYERASLLIDAAGAKQAAPQFTDRVTLADAGAHGRPAAGATAGADPGRSTGPCLGTFLRTLLIKTVSIRGLLKNRAKFCETTGYFPLRQTGCVTIAAGAAIGIGCAEAERGNAEKRRGSCMNVRQRTEEIERMTFAPWATFSDQSRGRMVQEKQDPIRPVFQRDRDRVLHCKAFRRLKQKTQVFLSPEGDLYRTRLTHTLEGSQIARPIARALRLNEDLTEAISLAHDLGHTPFGHAGEQALNELCPDGFKHYMQSLRVVDRLEKDGRGLNLTWEVRNGIVTHTKGTWAATPEGRIVRMADQIAFVNHDIEDAVRAGVLDPDILPKECTAVLGRTKSARITTMINSILANSEGDVKVGAEENEAFLALRDFMYATVYVDRSAKREEQKVGKVIEELYEYYLSHIDQMSNFYVQLAYQEGRERAVTDYISGMSDEFAIRTFEEIFVPQKWHVL